MTSKAQPHIGMGIYRLADVARYVGMHQTTIRNWFLMRSDEKGRGPVLVSDYGVVEGTFVVSFLDLIDALIASQFRKLGVSMREVRTAHGILAEELGVGHPFCHEDLYTDGERILRVTSDSISDERLSEVISSQQLVIQIKQRLAHVGYSPVTQLADHWDISNGVVINPAIGMGRPVIKSTATSTYVVANAYFANYRDEELVADLYSLAASQVMDAVRFESSLKSAA